MQVGKLGHGQISLEGNPIVTFTTWDEGVKSGGKILQMIGMTGIATGRAVTTINVENGVPVAGEQFDYRSLVENNTIVTMTTRETSGTQTSYKGILTSYDRNDGVDTEPKSKITFEGVKP